MDTDKRKALEERRRRMNEDRDALDAARAREARRKRVAPLTSALMIAGEPYDLRDPGENTDWQPGWLPSGGADFLWHKSPRATYVDHKGDQASEADALIASLAGIANANEAIVLVFRREFLTIRLSRGAFERHVGVLMEMLPGGFGDLWIAHPKGKWIIRTESKWAVTCLPPEQLPLADHEIWAAARDLLKEHGESAHGVARSLAQASAARDEADWLALWAEVEDRIRQLKSGELSKRAH